MKQNNAINILFLFLCVLLLGFVYLNTRMLDSFKLNDSSENMKVMEPKKDTMPSLEEIQ